MDGDKRSRANEEGPEGPSTRRRLEKKRIVRSPLAASHGPSRRSAVTRENFSCGYLVQWKPRADSLGLVFRLIGCGNPVQQPLISPRDRSYAVL